MAKQWMKLEGLQELRTALLEELPKATATNVQKRALMAAAEKMRADMESMAPVAPIAGGRLKRSIAISTKLSKKQRTISKKESKVEVYVGPGSVREAVPQEFGTYKMAPHPFVRPAWAANKVGALKMIRELLAAEIEKARARIARKAARMAAK